MNHESTKGAKCTKILRSRSHAPRGNAARTLCVRSEIDRVFRMCDGRSHAERGNEIKGTKRTKNLFYLSCFHIFRAFVVLLSWFIYKEEQI